MVTNFNILYFYNILKIYIIIWGIRLIDKNISAVYKYFKSLVGHEIMKNVSFHSCFKRFLEKINNFEIKKLKILKKIQMMWRELSIIIILIY